MTGTPIYDNLAAQVFSGTSHRPEQASSEADADALSADGQPQAERPASPPPA